MSGSHLQKNTGASGQSQPAPSAARPKKSSRLRPVWQLVLLDLLMTGLILCVFATFHHVIPRLRLQMGEAPEPIATAKPDRLDSQATAKPQPEPGDGDAEPTPEPTPDPDDWAALFAGHFTDQVLVTEDSYSSPNLSVTVSKVSTEYSSDTGSWPLTYFVADIYISDIRCFQTALPQSRNYENADRIARESGAVVAINGDFAIVHKAGPCVRNGDLYIDGLSSVDACVLTYDGVMKTYLQGTYDKETLLEQDPYQVWLFGPALLDSEGQPLTEFNTSSALLSRHPRTAVGYYEPGHYCFVVVDGRQNGYSAGLPMDGLAGLMADLGCKQAYNLDGGASSQFAFMGERINSPSGERTLYDMLIIREPEEFNAEETEVDP